MTELGLLDKVLRLHDALEQAHITHAFGGALALALHVEQPRATADIDLNISLPTNDVAQLLTALPEDISREASAARTVKRDGQVRLWWGRTPVDLFFPQHVFHSLVASRTVLMPLGEGVIPVLSATDLTIFKALFDRSKDWADIEEMVAFGSPNVDEAIAWLEEIVGVEDHRVRRLRELPRQRKPPPPTWAQVARPLKAPGPP